MHHTMWSDLIISFPTQSTKVIRRPEIHYTHCILVQSSLNMAHMQNSTKKIQLLCTFMNELNVVKHNQCILHTYFGTSCV